jgi:hypothetical protein
MITSNSTYAEINAQKSLDEQNIQDFLVRKLERDSRKLKKIFKTKQYYTPTVPATFHSHTTNIHWRILQILMHEKKPSVQERVRGITFLVESENQIKYTIINDLDTGKPMLVLPYPGNAFFVSAHAIRRYRERSLENEDLDFVTVCDRLVRRSPYYVCAPSRTIYGSTKFHTVVFRVADGMFLGYYNSERNVIFLETYISVGMLSEHQKNLSAFKYNDQLLRNQRDMVIGMISFDEELSDSMTSSAIYTDGENELKELSEEEIDELRKIAKEEYDAIPEEEHQQRIAEQQQANRERYDKKMIRKGYK